MTVKTIGIAGGIGSGKSTVTEYLRKKGYVVIDADEVSHAVTEAGQPAPGEIAELFGPETLLPGGSLDRRYMADIVFRDEAKLKSLNAILHKYIEEEVDTALQAAKSSGPVFLSAPLFFEANYERKTDEVWLISAADEIRIRRAAARDNADEQAIIARMEKQMPESERRERADIIIENNATA
ncbi:MAG: dephospho-CoA kinase, partial [Clostridiales Family XIII bacterium]|nr:dephospho-CoA kinase [Clostridiales Family XIII bacterium]